MLPRSFREGAAMARDVFSILGQVLRDSRAALAWDVFPVFVAGAAKNRAEPCYTSRDFVCVYGAAKRLHSKSYGIRLSVGRCFPPGLRERAAPVHARA